MNVEEVLWDDWHVVAEWDHLLKMEVHQTALFEVPLSIMREGESDAVVMRTDTGETVNAAIKYGHVWACLGTPERDIVSFQLAEEDDRICVSGGSIQVAISGLRIVENFLDIGHLPFVHHGYLGEEPHTEVP